MVLIRIAPILVVPSIESDIEALLSTICKSSTDRIAIGIKLIPLKKWEVERKIGS